MLLCWNIIQTIIWWFKVTPRLHILIQFTWSWKLPGQNYSSTMKGLFLFTDGEQWILKSGWQHLGKATLLTSLCVVVTPQVITGRNTIYLFTEPWIILNIWLQIKLFLESLHFTWAFSPIKWSGHYQLMPLFSLLLSQMNVMWFLHLVNKCDIYKAERETVKNSTWWEGSHFNGLLFGTLVLFSLTTQQTSLLGNCYNSAWCVSICEGFFPVILLSTVVFVS